MLKGFVLAGLLISLSSGAGAQVMNTPEDFGLRLEFGCGPMDVIDTFKGEFVRDLGTRGRKARAEGFRFTACPDLTKQLTPLTGCLWRKSP
jgi:hypothetical protein